MARILMMMMMMMMKTFYTAQMSLTETMPCGDMEKGTEEPKELEAVIRAAIIRLKCGYSL